MRLIDFDPLNNNQVSLDPSIALVGDWGFWSNWEEEIIKQGQKNQSACTMINFFVSNEPIYPILGTQALFKKATDHKITTCINYYLPWNLNLKTKTQVQKLLKPLQTKFSFSRFYIASDHPLLVPILQLFSPENVVVVDQKRKMSQTLLTGRKMLTNAQLKTYKNLFGANYNFVGQVIKGQQLGKKMGYPTANLATFQPLSVKEGVYLVKAQLVNQKAVFWGMGVYWLNPKTGLTFEVYLFDFDQEIYGQWLDVELIAYYRPNLIFTNLTDLKKQLVDDEVKLKALMKKL